MTKQIVLELTDNVYERAQQLVQTRHIDMTELMRLAFDKGLLLIEEERDVIDLTEPDEAVSDEIAAYHALHPMLWSRYPKQHVAIHSGQLLDHDENKVALRRRINQRYPNQFVLIRQVEREPERVLYFRSPRFAENVGFAVGSSNDFVEEVEQTAQNQELLAFLAARRTGNPKRRSLAQLKAELG
jgi:hypothetical protein